MTTEKYIELAMRSMKYHENKDMALADWALGLGGEWSEVIELFVQKDPGECWTDDELIELVKEIGDVLWYATALLRELEQPMIFPKLTVDVPARSTNHELLQIALHIGTVQEMLKHKIAHKEKFTVEQISEQVYGTLRHIRLFTQMLDLPLEQCLALNAYKLSHRYHGAEFDVKKSAERHARELDFTETTEYADVRQTVLEYRKKVYHDYTR